VARLQCPFYKHPISRSFVHLCGHGHQTPRKPEGRHLARLRWWRAVVDSPRNSWLTFMTQALRPGVQCLGYQGPSATSCPCFLHSFALFIFYPFLQSCESAPALQGHLRRLHVVISGVPLCAHEGRAYLPRTTCAAAAHILSSWSWRLHLDSYYRRPTWVTTSLSSWHDRRCPCGFEGEDF
jgi:hypothetical protein